MKLRYNLYPILILDDKLKALMEEDIENSVQAVDELKALLIS